MGISSRPSQRNFILYNMNQQQIEELIQEYLEGNGLEDKADLVFHVRKKLYVDVPVTLTDVLSGFYEFLKTRNDGNN